MSVTRFGVSLLNVVATIDRPASHHGTARPDAKNSEVLRPARRPKNNAGTKHSRSDTTMMIQSMGASVMASDRSTARYNRDLPRSTVHRVSGGALCVGEICGKA